MLEVVRLVLAGFLLLLGGLSTLTNGYILWLGIRHRGEESASSFVSYVPFIGGIAGVAGLSLVPLGSFSDRLPYLWIPFVLDLGSGLCLCWVVRAMVVEIGRKDGE